MTIKTDRDFMPVLADTVSRETPADVDISPDARAEAGSWAPSTRRAYVAGWKHFTSWCIDNRCPGLPSAPDDVGGYLEHLVATEGKTLATARLYLAAIAAAHRLGGHEDPRSKPLVKATLKRLARQYGKPRKQAKGLTSEALAAVKATARIQRVDQGRRRRKETEAVANRRALVDLALLQVMRDGLLRRSEAAALRWGDLEFHADGSGRLHVLQVQDRPSGRGHGALSGPRGRGDPAGHPSGGGGDRPGHQRLRAVGQPDLPESQGGDEDGGPG